MNHWIVGGLPTIIEAIKLGRWNRAFFNIESVVDRSYAAQCFSGRNFGYAEEAAFKVRDVSSLIDSMTSFVDVAIVSVFDMLTIEIDNNQAGDQDARPRQV